MKKPGLATLPGLLTLCAIALTMGLIPGLPPSLSRGASVISSAIPETAFLVQTYTNREGKTLPYRLLLPHDYNATNFYPVILYLHGAAARGQDNAEPLRWGPLLIAETGIQHQAPFILVVPQCPKDSGWQEWGWGAIHSRNSRSLDLALDLITNDLPRQFSIDPKRRYLTGVSMGGHAVWSVLIRQPGLFAAAVPVCAGGNSQSVTAAAARFPVWAFHSDDDHLVPVQQARDLVAAWRAKGGLAKYTEYTGLRHSSWKKAYTDPEMFRWLLSQHLP